MCRGSLFIPFKCLDSLVTTLNRRKYSQKQAKTGKVQQKLTKIHGNPRVTHCQPKKGQRPKAFGPPNCLVTGGYISIKAT